MKNSILYSFLLCAFSSIAFAGGPLKVAGNDGHTPVTYPNGTTIQLNFEKGTLGSLSNADAISLFMSGLNDWNTISTANLTLSRGPDIAVDVTPDNIFEYMNCFTCFSDGLNPVIFDDDGSITDLILGQGMSRSIVGFASSGFNFRRAEYLEGKVVMNGKIGLSQAKLRAVMVHEAGHFFGLDHTQIDNTQGQSGSHYPVMYPRVSRSAPGLHHDDIATVSELYPSANLSDEFGTIEGVFLNNNGEALLGANIWTQNINDISLTASKVSDYLKQQNGAFSLAVPPGDYTLHAESIQSNFNRGSGLGPYSSSPADISFQAPHPITPVTFSVSGVPQTLTVSAGCRVSVEFKLSGEGHIVDSDCEAPADTTPPELVVPGALTVEATGDLTVVNIGQATATDDVSTVISISNNAPNAFPLGTTTVVWTATDEAGNQTSASQTITVVDTTPPVVTVEDKRYHALFTPIRIRTLPQPEVVDIFGATVTNDAPEYFPEGDTLVTWTATDANGNVTTAVQKITVISLGFVWPF